MICRATVHGGGPWSLDTTVRSQARCDWGIMASFDNTHGIPLRSIQNRSETQKNGNMGEKASITTP